MRYSYLLDHSMPRARMAPCSNSVILARIILSGAGITVASFAPFADSQRQVTEFSGIISKKIENYRSPLSAFLREDRARRNELPQTPRGNFKYYFSRIQCLSGLTARISLSRELKFSSSSMDSLHFPQLRRQMLQMTAKSHRLGNSG